MQNFNLTVAVLDGDTSILTNVRIEILRQPYLVPPALTLDGRRLPYFSSKQVIKEDTDDRSVVVGTLTIPKNTH